MKSAQPPLLVNAHFYLHKNQHLRDKISKSCRKCDILLSECLFVWGECAWSATARLIMQTLGAMLFPFLDPGRHGDTMDLIGLGNGLDGRAGGTQQQTMGTAPRSEDRILFHRFF